VKWPLLIAGPAIFLASAGCGQPSPWFGAKEADLIGTYKPSSFDGDAADIRYLNAGQLGITLRTDHTAIISGFPEFDGFGDEVVCTLSGPARWKMSGAGIILDIENFEPHLPRPQNPEKRQCYNHVGIDITGRFSPHKLYLVIGDPDSGTGIELQRVSR
jgi:hypothetical protein